MDATITSTTTPLPPIPVSAAMVARLEREAECKRRAAGCCAAIRAYLVANLDAATKTLKLDATGRFLVRWNERIERF